MNDELCFVVFLFIISITTLPQVQLRYMKCDRADRLIEDVSISSAAVIFFSRCNVRSYRNYSLFASGTYKSRCLVSVRSAGIDDERNDRLNITRKRESCRVRELGAWPMGPKIDKTCSAEKQVFLFSVSAAFAQSRNDPRPCTPTTRGVVVGLLCVSITYTYNV